MIKEETINLLKPFVRNDLPLERLIQNFERVEIKVKERRIRKKSFFESKRVFNERFIVQALV